MRASVRAAWPAFCTRYEGRCSWLYLDTKRLPTTGTGNRVFDIAGMVALPWIVVATGLAATDQQKRNEWAWINSRTDLAPKGGYAFEAIATLRLLEPAINLILLAKTDEMWSVLAKQLPDLEAWPADAQLALLDMAWNLGPNFLGSAWPNFTRAAKAGDFTGCSAACRRAKGGERDDHHQALFTTAAVVVRINADREVLWDGRTPVVSAPAPVKPTPKPNPPKEPTVRLARYSGRAAVARARAMVNKPCGIGWCQKFTNEIFQTGSVYDYDGDGAADAEDGWKKAKAKGKVVPASKIKNYDDIPAAVMHYWLGGGSDHGHACVGVGGRLIVSTDMTNSGPRYGLVGLCDIDKPRQFWGLTYVGYALIEGNGHDLGSYQLGSKAQPTKEDDLPTPKDLLNADGIIAAPDNSSNKKKNPFWSLASYVREIFKRVDASTPSRQWGWDGIEAPDTSGSKRTNPTWTPASYLREIQAQNERILDRLEKLEEKIK